MTMPKKGSRSLTVDERKYRWSVKFTEVLEGWNDQGLQANLTVAVEDYDNPQNMLCVHYECGLPGGFLNAHPRSVETGEEVQLTPMHVAGLIRRALEEGWNPAEKDGKWVL